VRIVSPHHFANGMRTKHSCWLDRAGV